MRVGGHAQISLRLRRFPFAPVADIDHVRMIMGIAAKEGLLVRQVDVNRDFLHGETDAEVYTKQLKGFEKRWKEKQVWKLLKAIYGFKQDSLHWGSPLKEHLQ